MLRPGENESSSQGAPIGCIKAPFNLFQTPLGASGWTFLKVTVKLHAGKGLAGRQRDGIRSLIGNQGPY
jgi:hypothetical protein